MEELVGEYLNNISRHADLNAFIEVYDKEALHTARELDRRWKSDPGSLGKLAGVVVSLKDVLCYANHKLTAGSRILEGFTSIFSATAVSRLLAEDVIIIGRTNCDEFAMGSETRFSCYGPTKNAADPERVPGGSSGGAAVAVQINGCLASIGSDTGGSVRQPASFCGLYGFKPTYGRISRFGLIAYASSFDQIGIVGRDVQDIGQIYAVMAGPDGRDTTLSDDPVDNKWDAGPNRIGYIRSALDHPSIQPEIKTGCEKYLSDLAKEGVSVEPIDFPLMDYVIPAYYILTAAEASSNLARYDGVRYGFRSKDISNLSDMYTKTRTQGFGSEVKRRILLGTFVLSVGYYDAFFTQAQKVRRLIMEQFEEWFKKVDLIVLPTTPSTAWKRGELKDPVEVYLEDIYSVLANLAGLPAISAPLGLDNRGLSYGIQFLAARNMENDIFSFRERMKL
jgi:aspartyl-tRNA(Asn)/glutamyl-tRNA(Gln) amidotransferase subunit A